MDRLGQLRGEAGGSRGSTLDSSASSEAYITANDSSKFFSLEDDSSFDISPIKDVSLASAAAPDKPVAENDQLIPELSPIPKKNELLDSYKFGKQIEAANILSGGVDIFEDNDNSYDGNELVIDDNVGEMDDKSNPVMGNDGLPYQKAEEIPEALDTESDIASKDTEVLLQIDGKNVQAIDIGNGLYLYRKQGGEELAAVQIMPDKQDQPTFKFLKVRENAEGNLEVYEEIEIEVPKEVPTKEGKVLEKNKSHVPVKDINKVASDPAGSTVAERNQPPLNDSVPTTSTNVAEDSNKVSALENKSEVNLNGKMIKFHETRKSPVIHSTPNKEGIPLTKTMVDLQLHPHRHLDNVKTIEVHIDSSKQRSTDTQTKNKDFAEDNKDDISNKKLEKPINVPKIKKGDVKMSEETPNKNLNLGMPSIKLLENTETEQSSKELCTNSEKVAIGDQKETLNVATTSDMKETEATKEIKKIDNAVSANEGLSTQQIKTNNLNTKIVLQCQKTPEIAVSSTGHSSNVVNSSTSKVDERSREIVETLNKNKIDVNKIPALKEINISEVSEGISSQKEKNSGKASNINKDISEKCDTVTSNKIYDNVKLNIASNALTKNMEDTKQSIVAESANYSKQPIFTQNITSKKIEDSKQPILAESLSIKKIQDDNDPMLSQTVTVKKVQDCKKTIIVGNPSAKKIEDDKQSVLPESATLKKNQDSKQPILLENVINKKIENLEDSKQQVLTESSTSNKIHHNYPTITVKTQHVNITASKERINAVEIKQGIKTSVEEKPVRKDTTLTTIDSPKAAVAKDKSCVLSKEVSSSLHSKEALFTRATIAEQVIPCKQETECDVKINQQAASVNVAQRKPDVKPEVTKTIISNQKPINNNDAPVPFGKWTEANRQDYLNKFCIKETKVPTTYSNTKSLKQPNDLNRRDVLQKIDSQRQSSTATAKTQELLKLNVNPETTTFTKKPVTPCETKIPVKTEAPSEQKNKIIPPKKTTQTEIPQAPQKTTTSNAPTVSSTKQEVVPHRKEMNNQDLIDKTIEGIINRAVSAKPQEHKHSVPKEAVKTHKDPFAARSKSRAKQPSPLDVIEMKMNELHGIPFVERPPHELPKVYNLDIKTYAKSDNTNSATTKTTKIPNLLPFANPPKPVVKDAVVDLDSEEEIIEHEPITGDIDMHKKNLSKSSAPICTETISTQPNTDVSKKESIITEKEFDKFARRNSITYENCLTVNFEGNKQHNVMQALVEKEQPVKISRNELMLAESKVKSTKHKLLLSQGHVNKIQIPSKTSPISDESLNKNYPSKLQMAYTALTAKRQMESPITIIEDKPVKVVFMDNNTSFQPRQLNLLGKELSPVKKGVSDPDSLTTSTCDSLDSEILDAIDDGKVQDEVKIKTKHQRKQVLTPVETPELELIVPADLGVEMTPKKKRKTEESKFEKSAKSVVPKKSYLLGRNIVENAEPQNLTKNPFNDSVKGNNTIICHKDTASAIDNLVKAAELLETQSESLKASTNITSSEDTQQTPAKRGRGRPRKYPLPDGSPATTKSPSPQKKPRLTDSQQKKHASASDDDDTSDGEIVQENWTMGKINENIVCPICNKLFRSENVVFKHVKHCSGPSPSRSDSDKRSSRRSRFSRESDSKSEESKSNEMEIESEQPIVEKNIPKKRKSKDLSSDGKDVIVIEDTPVKAKPDKNEELKQHELKNTTKTKAQYKTSALSCEYCGKTFRQLSYLVSHKLIHKKESTKVSESYSRTSDKSVFSCEVCKKVFRKLHHLVQHRLNHNSTNAPSRSTRKSSYEQNIDSRSTKEQNSKQNDDQSAAFRCEPCDKSFRKLHHLVEHRETHDGINRQKSSTITQATVEKTVANPPPQCDVCKKTFRKLHHLIEHKEQHYETSSEKSDDKSVKSSLSTRDIIHECSLCYMVFPNEHSLNKHSVFCQKKKKQSAQKQAKQLEENTLTENNDTLKEIGKDVDLEPIPIAEVKVDFHENGQTDKESYFPPDERSEKLVKINEAVTVTEEEVKEKELSKEIEITELELVTSKKDVEEVDVSVAKDVKNPAEKTPIITKIEDEQMQEIKVKVTPKKKIPVKDKEQPPQGAKRRKSNLPLTTIKESAVVETSDDDEVRYMLNPDFKEETTEVKLFMKVKATKRSSLQFDKPSSKDSVKRRTSLQHPPKIPRLKSKDTDAIDKPLNSTANISKIVKPEPMPSTDSDDSDVKYSFPVKITNISEPEKSGTPKEKKKVVKPVVNRKSLTGIARRKTSGTTKHKEKASPVKQIKRRRAEVEHRCDCGQLFSSAALLARHASLAHTPPRVRRRRDSHPLPDPRKSAAPLAADTRKSDLPKATDTRKSVLPKATESRKSVLPKATESRKSVLPKTTESRKSVVPKATESRKSVVPKATESRKSSTRSETAPARLGRPPGKSPRASAQSPLAPAQSFRTPAQSPRAPVRTATKTRKSAAHRGVPVPDKMKKLIEKLRK